MHIYLRFPLFRPISVLLASLACQIYIYIYICDRMSSNMHILNSSLAGNEKLSGPVGCNVGGVKCQPISKA